MKRKIVSGIILSLLLIGMLTSAFKIQTVKTGSRAVCLDDGSIARPWDRESKVVRVIERRISDFDMQKLKQRVGLRQKNKDYSQIIHGHGTGLCPPTEDEWAEIAMEGHIIERILWLDQITESPSNVDLTNTIWFPPIGNQDGEGSCVSWAVGYYTKTFQEAKENEWDLSGAEWVGGYYGYPTPAYQDRIFSPDFVYHLINGGVDQGSSFFDAINLVCAIGASSWKEMPYDPGDSTSWPSEDAWEEAPLYRGNSSGFEYLELNTDDDLISLKNWIASDNLAVIAVDAGQYSSLTSEDIWTLDNYVNPDTNHANTIVGYDDNIEYTEGEELRYGAFKIANSWGEGVWENVPDGCYWISYEAMKQRIEYCMFYRDRIGYKSELVSSFRIDHSKRAECDILIGMGSYGSPDVTKSFSNFVDGGDHPFCSNNILFDITEFKDAVPTVYGQSFFIRVYDGGSVTTGTITNFSIQYAVSEDPPITTVNGEYVFADVVLPNTIRVPLNYATIQDAINAVVLSLDEDPRVTIQVAPGTYYEHVIVNKTVSLVGENRTTTIIDGQHLWEYVVEITANNSVIKGFTVKNSKSNGPYCGIWVHGHNVTVENNIVEGNIFGVLVLYGNGTIRNNEITNNTDGIKLYGELSSRSIVSENIITDNLDYGVWLQATSHNRIVCNLVVNNTVGIGISLGVSSHLNVIYHNNFLNNTKQTSLDGDVIDEIWDDGYPSGGNYWSDHNPPDVYSGPNQDILGRDGVGDIPYIIDENNTDRFPLIYPYGYVPSPDVNDDGIVNIRDMVTVAIAFGGQPGDPNWNPTADIKQDGKINIFDIVTVAIHFGETYP